MKYSSGSRYVGTNRDPNYNATRAACNDTCLILTITFVVVGVIALIALFFIWKRRQRIQKENEERQFQKEETDFLQSDLQRINESTLLLLDQMNTSLKSSSWILEQAINKKTQPAKQFDPQFFINEQEPCIEIRADGEDVKGVWKCKGHIKFAEKKWKLFMSKVYLDRKKAGQVGTFSMIICEGDFTDDLQQCTGEWWVKNHRGHPDYRGFWEMKAMSPA